MSKRTIFAVFGAAILLVAVFAAATFVQASAPAMPQTGSAAVDSSDYFLGHPELARFDAEAIPVHAVTPRSLMLSEKVLRARLDEAYERGTPAQVQALLDILNGRYERRQGGLPY